MRKQIQHSNTKKIGTRNTNCYTNTTWLHKYNMTTQILHGDTNIKFNNKYNMATQKNMVTQIL